MSDETRLAKSARITRKAVEIDGEPFPFYIAENGVDVIGIERGEFTRLRIDVIIDGPVEIEDLNVSGQTQTSDEEREQIERWQGAPIEVEDVRKGAA
jgi:hypothetical protein